MKLRFFVLLFLAHFPSFAFASGQGLAELIFLVCALFLISAAIVYGPIALVLKRKKIELGFAMLLQLLSTGIFGAALAYATLFGANIVSNYFRDGEGTFQDLLFSIPVLILLGCISISLTIKYWHQREPDSHLSDSRIAQLRPPK